ncbi:uncharacterized protein MEPE_01683 [Melanopsichium pennsylvanicum]|uniref:Uncharacterized protein n=2 Tax=Melanopsichium pennsylvanicum TaxID=63383 RepID=A0AAJ4XJ48_9BASI|nr:conserved hypothetical protein [Melanopsichium pennsylvanicum 4]SNX82977.1 uncharacterized protein MEPE_01683 [Melanopsichium pennsylvanicum]
MASLGRLDTLCARDEETLSVKANTEIDLDSTGAGSPPSSAFPHSLSSSLAQESHRPSQHASSAGRIFFTPESKQATSSRSSLESALGEILVISGGSGYNDLVGATPLATYVMPISDNGGSSSEIIRVLGGPSIGDLRSRLNRLIPTPSRHSPTITFSQVSSAAAFAKSPPQSNEAIHNLLSYRLPSQGSLKEIKQEWMDILEGRHPLWQGIEPERKEVIRGFLVHFESEVLRRAHRRFNFRGGSIGNFFLAAAQMFFRSIQSAIFLFSATTQINSGSGIVGGKVLPVINTNHTATIAAELEDGEILVGQCEISHPAPKTSRVPRINLNSAAMEKSTSLASQPPGTPGSTLWDRDGLLAVDALQDLGSADGGPGTPGFGPPAHYHVNNVEPFASGLNYISMNGSVDALGADLQKKHAKGGTGSSAPFVQLVDERAAACARKGLTTVGNQKDGLDPEDDDVDSQDGIEQADSPCDTHSAADYVHTAASPHDASSNTPSSGSNGSRIKEKTRNIIFSKTEDDEASLPSPIRRVVYVNAYRNEIYPAPNPSFILSLSRSKTLIYSCGSLWTSIVPCLALRSVATTIATSPTLHYKVLLLNSVPDRETRGMDAVDFINAICGSLNDSDQPTAAQNEDTKSKPRWRVGQLVTHLVYFEEGEVKVDAKRLEEMGVKCVVAEINLTSKKGVPKFDEESVKQALFKIITLES